MSSTPIKLTEQDRIAIREAAKEIDPEQVAISRKLTSDQRIRKVLSLSKLTRRLGIQRILEKHPELSEAEAQRIWLARYYELESRTYGNPRP